MVSKQISDLKNIKEYFIENKLLKFPLNTLVFFQEKILLKISVSLQDIHKKFYQSGPEKVFLPKPPI